MTIRHFDYLPNTHLCQQLVDEMKIDCNRNTSRKVDKPLVLYGAGNLGCMAKEYCDRLTIPITLVIDQLADQQRNDDFWAGLEIVMPQYVSTSTKQNTLIAVCVANCIYSEVETELKQQGWVDIVHIYDIAEAYRDQHPLSNGWYAKSLDKENVKQVLAGWSDDESRAYHLQFIAWRCIRQDWIFEQAPMLLSNRYVIPEIVSVLTKNEIFIDIGGHIGETTRLLLQAVNYQFDSVSIFEPDRKNIKQLKTNLTDIKQKVIGNIDVREFALGECKQQRQFFDGAGYASQLSQIGKQNVEVVDFDGLDMPVSVMKLHLEGAELDVLKGAKASLKMYRPIVMMTCYHNELGLHEMPNWLMRELDDYEFLFRMHSGCGTGAVIYGIPKERRSDSDWVINQ